jgi:DsbC/DsbD-like thiol-disulfide interchange protein
MQVKKQSGNARGKWTKASADALIKPHSSSGIFPMPRLLPFLLLLWQLIPASAAKAEHPPASFAGKGLTVQLVSDAGTIQPGQIFHLGLWIHHDPDYHTYWINPGLAGITTQLKPQLPPGFTAGTLIFPPPDKVNMAALRVHGYKNDILLALPITAPTDLRPGPVTFPVDAAWMCCHRTCNPGNTKLSLTLASAANAVPDAAWTPKFEALQQSQPPALTGWNLSARRLEKEIELTAVPPAGLPLPEEPQFFSLDNLICSHPLQVWEKAGTGYRVKLSLSDFPPEDQTQLRGLLSAQGSWQKEAQKNCVSIAVPIQAAE